MEIISLLRNRRTNYNIGKNLPVSEDEIIEKIMKVTELVPDAFNSKSARLVIALGEKQDVLWDNIYDVFNGAVPREKIDSFKKGAGTVLFFIDTSVVKGLQDSFPNFADNFPKWALQANAMLQINIWTLLSNMDMGASLQHYNPVIDNKVREMFDLPENYELIAEMPFGGVLENPSEKPSEDVLERIKISR